MPFSFPRYKRKEENTLDLGFEKGSNHRFENSCLDSIHRVEKIFVTIWETNCCKCQKSSRSKSLEETELLRWNTWEILVIEACYDMPFWFDLVGSNQRKLLKNASKRRKHLCQRHVAIRLYEDANSISSTI